jgi:hypothetical protein
MGKCWEIGRPSPQSSPRERGEADHGDEPETSVTLWTEDTGYTSCCFHYADF